METEMAIAMAMASAAEEAGMMVVATKKASSTNGSLPQRSERAVLC
jgi:hypothetical protein